MESHGEFLDDDSESNTRGGFGGNRGNYGGNGSSSGGGGYPQRGNFNQQNGNQGGGGWNQGQRYGNNGGNNGGQNFGNKGGWNGNRNSGGGGGGFQKGGFRGGNRFQKEEDTGPAKLYKTYVGTGNRETPPDVMAAMTKLAKDLEEFGFMLRSGGKDGPEEAFSAGTAVSEIHIPWKGFGNKDSKFTYTPPHAIELARMFHPAFDGLKPVIQTFLAQNVRMVMGKDLKSPTMFVVGWSEDGAESIKEKTMKTGAFGHVIAIASAMKIPVFNMQKADAVDRIKRHVGIITEDSNDI